MNEGLLTNMTEKEIVEADINIEVLGKILEKVNSMIEHIDTQINVLIGVSSAIFVFISTRFVSEHLSLPVFCLGFFSAAATVIGLMGIHPPRFMRKRGQSESLMYSKKIASFRNADAYAKELREVLEDSGKITTQIAREIYNMCAYYYRPKRKLYSFSRDFLLYGIVISALVYMIQFVFKF